jgi:hypothetical protein
LFALVPLDGFPITFDPDGTVATEIWAGSRDGPSGAMPRSSSAAPPAKLAVPTVHRRALEGLRERAAERYATYSATYPDGEIGVWSEPITLEMGAEQ